MPMNSNPKFLPRLPGPRHLRATSASAYTHLESNTTGLSALCPLQRCVHALPHRSSGIADIGEVRVVRLAAVSLPAFLAAAGAYGRFVPLLWYRVDVPLADTLSPRVGLRLLRWFVCCRRGRLASQSTSATEHHGAYGHAGPMQRSVGLVLLPPCPFEELCC